MADDELTPWSLDEHLRAGAAALDQIERNDDRSGPQPICHHFYSVDPIDPIEVSVEATFNGLLPVFAELGLEFLPDRLEAWETGVPTLKWLNMRIPTILKTARTSRLEYQGWSWEPCDRQPVNATNFVIINNRTG